MRANFQKLELFNKVCAVRHYIAESFVPDRRSWTESNACPQLCIFHAAQNFAQMQI